MNRISLFSLQKYLYPSIIEEYCSLKILFF